MGFQGRGRPTFLTGSGIPHLVARWGGRSVKIDRGEQSVLGHGANRVYAVLYPENSREVEVSESLVLAKLCHNKETNSRFIRVAPIQRAQG